MKNGRVMIWWLYNVKLFVLSQFQAVYLQWIQLYESVIKVTSKMNRTDSYIKVNLHIIPSTKCSTSYISIEQPFLFYQSKLGIGKKMSMHKMKQEASGRETEKRFLHCIQITSYEVGEWDLRCKNNKFFEIL